MLFNSIDFAIFLPIVFLIYWFFPFKKIKHQNLFILIASYVFYGWWDWRFLSLIIISSFVDFTVGKKLILSTKKRSRKRLLLISIILNLGFLGIFKYYNFFAASLIDAFTFLGVNFNLGSLNVILPVGISFYTFQTMSYTIDIYNKKLSPTHDMVSFFAFVSFFPQLVAGPIERASNLLPQFEKKRRFSNPSAADGVRQMLWGFFKKIVIADNCAPIVNDIFSNSNTMTGSTLFLGAILFSFQIYGDFSGYSDIAIGLSRLFGFNLKRNFAYPYFSRDIAEFWRRWHISLSSWFRDYVYIPLGGSRLNLGKKIRNIFVIFIISGFWHGANWTFVIWGFLNALFIIPLIIFNVNRSNIEIASSGKLFPRISDLVRIVMTFLLTSFAWIFFRADSINHAFQYISRMFTQNLFSFPSIAIKQTSVLFLILILIIVEWFQREKPHALEISNSSNWIRTSIYVAVISIIFLFAPIKPSTFIYFQF